MTPPETLLPQQQHPRPQPAQQLQHPLRRHDDHDHNPHRPPLSAPASPYDPSYPTKDARHGPSPSQHPSPSTPHPPQRHQPGDPYHARHASADSDAEHATHRPSSRGTGFGHIGQQDQQSWHQPYSDPSPDRPSHPAPLAYTLAQYPGRDHAGAPQPGARDHHSQPYPYPSQLYSSPPSSSYGGAPPAHDHYHSPHARTMQPLSQEHSSWVRQGPTPPSSYHPDQSMGHANADASTRRSATPASDRRYVLTSVNSTAASFVPRRLSTSHPSNCSALEPAAVASSARASPQSTSPVAPTQRPPMYGHEQTFVRGFPQARDNGSRAIPPPIRTKWTKELQGDCPQLSFQSGSSLSMSSKSADSKMSPSTPRSSQLTALMAPSTLDDPNAGFDPPKSIHSVLSDFAHQPLYCLQSPVDYRDDRQYRDEHDMEHCSEQDDVRERDHEDDEDDEDEDEDEGMHARKMPRHHLAMDNRVRPSPSRSTRTLKSSEHGPVAVGADDEDEDMDEGNSTFASSSGSRKPSLTSSPQRDETKSSRKPSKIRMVIQKLIDEAVDYEEDNQGQDGLGAQSLHGKGLGYYAPLVCECVEARRVTSYNDLVQDLAGGDRVDGAATQEQTGQGNIRRRVYDALNILEALGIISMDKKEIRWIGIQNAMPIREVSRRVQLTNPSVSLQSLEQRERDGADESEEPEDDDMEIEQLQKEVEAMKLRNALESARLEDQVARNVQVNNLIERNKHREEKEMERRIRRDQRKLERKEARRAQAAAGGESMDIDDGGNDPNGAADEQTKRSERRHHRHHRHRSPRLENEGDESGEMNGGMGEQVDEETARRVKEEQRKERRLRKEQKLQRRQEKEERIQLPLLIVRVPGYAGQSSDSEASISVMRSVRKEQKLKKSGNSKRHCVATGEETTMVEIKIPHQEELSIISDTEILGDLGLNQVRQDELHAMLPQEALDSARYTTKTTVDGCGGEEVMVTVRGGFERALVCAAGL